MTRVHIIGVGSPFGDDQLGWRAAEALRRAVVELGAENTVHVMQCATPGGELVDALCEADAAILIDALCSGASVGEVRRFGPEAVQDLPAPVSSHGFGLAHSLALARAMGALPVHTVLFGIEIEPAIEADPSDEPGDAVTQAIPGLLHSVRQELRTLLEDCD